MNSGSKCNIKFDASPGRPSQKVNNSTIISPSNHLNKEGVVYNDVKNEESKRSLSQAPKIELPSLNKNRSKRALAEIETTQPLPEILQRHVPNVLFSKFASRKANQFSGHLNYNPNIEYRNIFPQILSSNRKIAINVSLDRMPDRNFELTANKPSPAYDPNYTLVDKKVRVPPLGGYKQPVHIP